MYKDSRNLSVTASSQATIELLDAAVDSYLGMRKDVSDRTADLVAKDPECPLAQCLSGYIKMHAGKPEAVEDAANALERAKLSDATGREKLHILALQAWLDGDMIGALRRWEEILTQHPTDILAVRLAQFITSYLGRSLDIRDSVVRVLPAWDPGMPGYGFLLGCLAYGLEEAGEYESAERFGREAVERNPEDLWASHAVAHVMEMQCRPQQGIEWVKNGQPKWRECGNFQRHLWWHSCLFHLTLQDYDRVLELYDQEVRPESTDEYLDIANCAGLLWRLEESDIEVGHRWDELAARAESHVDDHLFVFADLHYVIAVAARANTAAVLNSCSEYARTENRTQARVMKRVGLAIAQASVAHRNHQYSRAADLLLPVKDLICRVGGSHAQRDLFEQMLIDSTIRDHRLLVARSLLSERVAKRPCDLWAWRHMASVCEALQDRENSIAAQSQVHKLLFGATPSMSRTGGVAG